MTHGHALDSCHWAWSRLYDSYSSEIHWIISKCVGEKVWSAWNSRFTVSLISFTNGSHRESHNFEYLFIFRDIYFIFKAFMDIVYIINNLYYNFLYQLSLYRDNNYVNWVFRMFKLFILAVIAAEMVPKVWVRNKTYEIIKENL